jgi:ubiquinone/menaquinone biosynthesis C-methylase UbiE
MNSFEQQYYEDESFWSGDMLQDEANKLRITYTASLIPDSVKNLADIGCGNGVFVNYLSKARPDLRLVGVDRSEAALQFVKTEKEKGDISNLHFPDRSFDCVTCLEVIEHLPVPIYHQSLEQLARIAKDYLVVSVPFSETLEESYNQCPSCKTVFNLELHLRSFSREYFTHLFDEFGFTCVKHDTFGRSVRYKGHYTFRKLFYPEQFRQWKSPICPVCGYQDPAKKQKAEAPASAAPRPKGHPMRAGRKKWVNYFTAIPKLIWPKETRFYWIIGVFKRNS